MEAVIRFLFHPGKSDRRANLAGHLRSRAGVSMLEMFVDADIGADDGVDSDR